MPKKYKPVVLAEEETLTTGEFNNAFKKVLEYNAKNLLGSREQIATALNQIQGAFNKLRQDIESKMAQHSTSQKDTVSKTLRDTVAVLEGKMSGIEASVQERLASLKDGESADGQAILESLKAFIPAPMAGSPDKPEDVRNKLETLKGDERLDKSAIKGLQEEIATLRKELSARAGASISNLRIQQAFKYILKTEAPTGAINSSNKSYTVSQAIFAVLSFSLNGETIAQLPNYTINGRTITFATALPSAYSGKDFEVKYI